SPMVEEDIHVKARTFKQMEEDRLGEEAAKRLHDEEQANLDRKRAELQRWQKSTEAPIPSMPETLIKVVVTEDSDDEASPVWSVVVGWEVLPTPLGDINALYRIDGSTKHFTTLWQILHMVDRQDLVKLYGLVVQYYKDHPVAGVGLILWGDLQVLFDSHARGQRINTKKRKMVVSDSDQEDGGKQDVNLDALRALANAAMTVDSNIPSGGTSQIPAASPSVPTAGPPGASTVLLGTFAIPTGASTVPAGSPSVPADVPFSVAPAGVSSKGKSPMVEEDIPVKARTFKQMEKDRLAPAGEGAEVAAQAVPQHMPTPDQPQAHLSTPSKQQTSDPDAPILEHGQSSNPNTTSFSWSHETDAGPFTNVEDAPKVHSLETKLTDHKNLFKDVVGKLVKKVKALEVKLKTKKRKMVVSDGRTG
nr:hypothetical protein [Tanacetum cinerariifolium]